MNKTLIAFLMVMVSIGTAVGGGLKDSSSSASGFYTKPLLFDLAPDPKKSGQSIERFGPVGMSLDLIQPAFTMRIKSIEPGSPAAATGKLKVGQIIETINGAKLHDIDPRIQLGDIITAAEATDGIIKLRVTPSLGEPEVVVKIPVLGAYSKTWPLNCPKSDKIVRTLADNLAKSHNGTFEMLFLLGTGEDKDLAPVRNWVHGLADKEPSHYSWHLGFGGIPLCEYYLRTGDEATLPVIQKWVEAAMAGEYFGGWGHKGICAAPTYGPGGGQMNAGGTAVVTFLMLAKECGAKIPDDFFNRVLTRFYRYAGRGLVPYGDGRPEWGFVDNGKNGNLAFAMAAAAALTPDGENSVYAKARDISAKSGFYTTSYMLHGHTGGGIGEIWRSSAMGLLQDKLPRQYREFMDARRWHYELSRRFDGTFWISEGGFRYAGQEWGAGYALTYVVPRKTLRITGAPPTKFSKQYTLPEHPWGTKADEVFLSLQPAAFSDGKRPDFFGETLIQDHAWAILQRLNRSDVDDATLLRYAHHPDSSVRLVAARRVMGLVSGHLSTKPSPGGEIHKKLAMDLFHSADPRVRRAILHAMGEKLKNEQEFMGLLGQKGTDELIGMLRDPAESWWVKDAVLLLMNKVPVNSADSQVDLILGFVNDKEPWLQHASLGALSTVVGDERCYAKVIPVVAEKIRTCNQMFVASAMQSWAGLGSKLMKSLPSAAQKLWEKSASNALVNYAAPKRAPGGLNITRLNDFFLSDLAVKIVAMPDGYDKLYEFSKQRWPDNPLYFSQIFLKANPEKFGSSLRQAYEPWVRQQLIPEFIANNLSVLVKEAEGSSVGRGEQPALDQLAKLYQEAGANEYNWHDFGPAWNKMEWNYFTFDLSGKASDDTKSKVTFPQGMEQWYTPSFDPVKAGWKIGKQPFGQMDGQLMKQPRSVGNALGHSDTPQQTLWDKEVLLLNGKFQFPKFREGCRYRLVFGGIGTDFRAYINGKPLVEKKKPDPKGNKWTFNCPSIAKNFWMEFDHPVTIATIGFLSSKTTAPVKRGSPVPNGDFSLWLQEMKLPPLGQEAIMQSATAVPMLCSEWQAMQDPDREVDDPDEGKFRWNGKFVANAKLLGEWVQIGQVDTIDEFDPAKQVMPEKSSTPQKLTFKDQGKTGDSLQIWSGDVLMNFRVKQVALGGGGKGVASQQASKVEAQKLVVKTINGTDYLFREVGGFSDKQSAGWQSPWCVMKRSAQ